MKIMGRYGKVMVMSAAALAMTAALTIQSASAYFTTYVEASGGEVVSLGATTEIEEEQVTNLTKHVSVYNNSGVNECFVRVKVFSGNQVTCTPVENNNWTSGEDGYWYYGPVLGPKAKTDILDVKIELKDPEEAPDSFNVVVIQECTPVIYDEEGNPKADWNSVIKGDNDNTGREEAGN